MIWEKTIKILHDIFMIFNKYDNNYFIIIHVTITGLKNFINQHDLLRKAKPFVKGIDTQYSVNFQKRDYCYLLLFFAV